MNLRDIKKDIEYVLGAFIDDCSVFATVNPKASDDDLANLFEEAADLYNELKDKVNAIEALAATGRGGKGEVSPVLRDAILALSALGFNEEAANKMVSQVIAAHPDAKDTETIIRFALKG